MKLTLAVLLLSAAAFAQSKNPVTDVLRESLAGRQKNTVAAIDEMPADKFGFKPTPEQMSFGHLATHIVEANYFFCAKVGDVPQPKLEQLPETAAKDKLVAAVTASFDFCGTALAKRKTRSLAIPFRILPARRGRGPGQRWLSPAAGQITTVRPPCISG